MTASNLGAEIILINSISDLNLIPEELLKKEDVKVFSFNLESHRALANKKIKHEMADNLLSQTERLRLFDTSLKFLSWYSAIPSNDLQFDNVNLLKIFDSHEFQSFLMPHLVNLITIKRVIEKEKPTKIISTNSFSHMILAIIKDSKIETKFFQNKIEQKLLWDRITIKYNLGPIPISFNLSRNKYVKIKKFIESIIGFFYNFWFDVNSSKKKSIVLLEFNTEYFSDLLKMLKDYDGNVILVNRRRSAVWSAKAINTIRKSNCKIINFDNILTSEEKREIPLLVDEYSKKLEKLWENSEFFNNLFQIENCSFWSVIKNTVIKSYSEKLPEYIRLICCIKSLLKNMDVRCLVSLNEIGETERAFLESNKNKIPFIVLEHGFIERVDDTKRFDKMFYANFSDKIAVWGDMKKQYLINEYGVDPNRIFVTGSPRHDFYFKSRTKRNPPKVMTVLLAPNPITVYSGLANTLLELKFENTIERIISTLKKFDNVKIVVKLHQIQIKHNLMIKSIIKKIDNTIPVYTATPVIKTINNADVIVIISSERFGTSTMLLESMILGKPTMNIVLDDDVPQFTHVKDNAVFAISDNSNLEESFKKILFDLSFQEELIKNADIFVSKFLNYRGNASEKFALLLKSF